MSFHLHPLALAAGALVLYRLTRSSVGAPASSAPPGPQPLQAGLPYLLLVRLPPGSDAGSEAAARELLEQKGASNVSFTAATLPPELKGTGPWGSIVVSFKVVPNGNASIERGKPFYGIGTLEQAVRLDGRPFAQKA